MNAPDPFASFSNFAFSSYGLTTFLILLALFGLLWSDQLKRRWYDRVERRKWQKWNGPKPARKSAIQPEAPSRTTQFNGMESQPRDTAHSDRQD